jgi:iron-sulfur cluster insertion protein
VFVQGGGCSGFSYGFTLDEQQNEDDFDFSYDEIKVLIDSMSFQYLQDASIDYKEDLMNASFVINNPQAQSTCGCGSSFSV